ncbi:hypothetical protein EV175_000279 [Coemansia sp. RSA 1933]|nr:hypothetical protein EV175_000279 [Coemansia sp. RSA 1933]
MAAPHSDAAFAAAFNNAIDTIGRGLYYGTGIQPRVTLALASPPTVEAEWLVTGDHISANGSIDEGVVATVSDNTLAALGVALQAAGALMSLAVTELSAHTVRSIQPGTMVRMRCSLDSDPFITQPHATTVFCNSMDPACVYAVVFAAAARTAIANTRRPKL